MNNHVNSAPQSKKEENREKRITHTTKQTKIHNNLNGLEKYLENSLNGLEKYICSNLIGMYMYIVRVHFAVCTGMVVAGG